MPKRLLLLVDMYSSWHELLNPDAGQTSDIWPSSSNSPRELLTQTDISRIRTHNLIYFGALLLCRSRILLLHKGMNTNVSLSWWDMSRTRQRCWQWRPLNVVRIFNKSPSRNFQPVHVGYEIVASPHEENTVVCLLWNTTNDGFPVQVFPYSFRTPSHLPRFTMTTLLT